MAIAAMGERYGDRLVGQLAQAGGMIENGLKAVTTMKELQSLGQTLSQISPESPDYQQQLMQLGASHPFAMQDPRGQALVSMGNQQHLQWKNQQFAMQQADRADARATRHDDMAYRRAVTLAGMRQKQGDEMVDFNDIGLGRRRLSPTLDFGQDVNVPASFNQASLEMGNAPEAAGVEAVSDQPMKIGLGGRIRNPGLTEGDDGFDYASGLSGTVVPETETPAEDAAEGQEEPNELASEMRNLAMAAGGNISKKDLPKFAAIASANVRARHAVATRAAAGKKGSTGVLYATEQEAIDALDGTALGDGLFESPNGGVYKPKQATSGKWYLSSPDDGDMTEREKFEAGLESKRQAQNYAEMKSEEAAARADYNRELGAMEKTVRDAEKAFINAIAAKDEAYAGKDKKLAAAAQAFLETAEKHKDSKRKELEDFKKTKPKSESSSGTRKSLTAEVKSRLIKLANGDLKKAAEMARKEGYIP